jgi:hypothetical protein
VVNWPCVASAAAQLRTYTRQAGINRDRLTQQARCVRDRVRCTRISPEARTLMLLRVELRVTAARFRVASAAQRSQVIGRAERREETIFHRCLRAFVTPMARLVFPAWSPPIKFLRSSRTSGISERPGVLAEKKADGVALPSSRRQGSGQSAVFNISCEEGNNSRNQEYRSGCACGPAAALPGGTPLHPVDLWCPLV